MPPPTQRPGGPARALTFVAVGGRDAAHVLPVVMVANDRGYMGEYANGPLRNTLAVLYMPAATKRISGMGVPLLFLTHMGNG